MRYRQKQSGFSAVELLITLFIGVIFFIAGFQLYATIIKNGGDARMQSSANNVAADYLQRYESSATSPCTPQNPLTGSAVSGSGLTSATVTVTITCPNITSPSFSASGGTITYSGGYTVHTFNSVGTFSFTSTGTKNLEVLVVAGGGGGGKAEASGGGDGAGGGGAGGVVYTSSYSVSGIGTNTTVTVGVGGAGTNSGTYPTIPKGANGNNSVFGSLTATGGGGGGSDNDAPTTYNMGAVGGSGGGASNTYNQATSAASGTVGQGWAGGDAIASPTAYRAGSGGGGAGGIGVTRTSVVGGNGGPGVTYSINGTSATYAAGGGGGAYGSTGGAGGTGGNGGNGGGINGNGGDSTFATGGGGGGGGSNNGSGGHGGSGIVIVRYPTPVATPLTNVSKIVATVTYGNSQTVSTSTYVSTAGIVTNGLALNLDAGSNASYPDGGPTWNDLTNNGNNGTLSATGVTYSSSNSGILTFNGSSGNVNSGNSGSLDINGPITLDGWVKVSSTAAVQAILLKSSAGGNLGLTSYGLSINAGGAISNVLYSSSIATNFITGSSYITAGNWYNIVSTWDGSTTTANNVKIYVNGAQVQSFSKTDTLNSNWQTLSIGSQQAAGNFLNGSIGAVKIYNRALTDNEITQNFNAIRGRYGL
jgi:Tfp pilus assembly protein PilV